MHIELENITAKKSKKLLTVLLAAALTLSLCACDKADNNSESNTENSGESSFSSTPNGTNSTEQSAPVGGDTPSVPAGSTKLKLLASGYNKLNFYFGFAVYAAEDGLYYLKDVEPRGFNLYGNLMYIDYATKQETYLCSDSSCKHDSERCASYMANSDLYATNGTSQLFVYNDSLYFLSMMESSDGRSSHGGLNVIRDRPELYRMNLDGSGRELVYTFDKDLAVEMFAVGDGNALWFYVKTPVIDYDEETEWYSYSSKDRSLIKLDLSDYSIVEQIPLYKYKEYGAAEVWDCSDSMIIFRMEELPEGMTEQDFDRLVTGGDPVESSKLIHEITQKSQMVYFTVDLTNKEIKEVFRHPLPDEYAGFTEGEYAYFTNTNDRSTVRVNLDNGEQSEFFPAEGYVAVGTIDGKYECRSVDKNDSTVYFIDIESGEITSSAVKSHFEPEETIMSDAMAFGKDYVLIRTNETINKEPHGRHFISDYAVIPLDDFFNGRENYEPVKMIR